MALYPEVEYFQDGDIDLIDLLPPLIGKVYYQMIDEDKGETTSNYVHGPAQDNIFFYRG